MIIGEDFVWAHLGKTAGDATYDLFQAAIPDLIVAADPPESPSKHRSFLAASVGPLEGKTLLLNLRRLPAWRLSMAHHRARHGSPSDPTPKPMPAPEDMARDGLGDSNLAAFTGGHQLTIDRGLRMEHLVDDFLAFASELRPLTDEEIERTRVAGRPSKQGDYNHETREVFPPRLERALYDANPVWAELEERVYGGLPFERRWWHLGWFRSGVHVRDRRARAG
ncbi:MAG: hypothetical protein KY461_06795 [Actinobacteria bacterium]|nr:hypothetical protein [Actinomycetota bacterium]